VIEVSDAPIVFLSSPWPSSTVTQLWAYSKKNMRQYEQYAPTSDFDLDLDLNLSESLPNPMY
jgi:hypothetical protein